MPNRLRQRYQPSGNANASGMTVQVHYQQTKSALTGRAAIVVLAALAGSACSGGLGETGGLSLPNIAAVQVPKVELPKVDLSKVELPKVDLPETIPPVVGAPTDVYSRIAAGAMSCWFGPAGPLKAGYIYHADADSPSRGGKAEIVVHERDRIGKDPRGARALRVDIAPEGDSARVLVENLRLPPDLGNSLKHDVDRWAGGAAGCAPMAEPRAWTAATPAPAVPAKPVVPAKGVTTKTTSRKGLSTKVTADRK